jgi:ATP-dependent RNA helicase DeaD
MTASATARATTFQHLGLSVPLLQAINAVGYEVPTPIQAQAIPPLLGGRDVIGQAQTGTGKTAAFALPMLERLEAGQPRVQALVLVPTRELALQVAEAIHTYARDLERVRVLSVYGGQPIDRQMARLRGGVQVIVGTPGRIMDHLRRETLSFEALKMVVLDEADEMLRMGFIEDVEWILAHAPGTFQTALFTATMPMEVRRLAARYLKDPVQVAIQPTHVTVPATEQYYLNVPAVSKLQALTQVLESEPLQTVLIFVRTKVGAANLAEQLQVRGYAAEALHGDLGQAARENVMRRLRTGELEILIATDVAARGLDVPRISHVVNYDIPCAPEVYVHRIGRTGRAGRGGRAILFLTPREQRLLREIERYIGQRLKPMKLPTKAAIAARRIALFKDQMCKTLTEGELDLYLTLVEELAAEGFEMAEIAAAAARLARRDTPLEVVLEREASAPTEQGMVRLLIDAGRQHGVRPSDIVGAIANEAGVPGRAIGSIDIEARETVVELPQQYQAQVLKHMAHTAIRNRPIRITVTEPEGDRSRASHPTRRPRDRRQAAGGRSHRPAPESSRGRDIEAGTPSHDHAAGSGASDGRRDDAHPRRRPRR